MTALKTRPRHAAYSPTTRRWATALIVIALTFLLLLGNAVAADSAEAANLSTQGDAVAIVGTVVADCDADTVSIDATATNTGDEIIVGISVQIGNDEVFLEYVDPQSTLPIKGTWSLNTSTEATRVLVASADGGAQPFFFCEPVVVEPTPSPEPSAPASPSPSPSTPVSPSPSAPASPSPSPSAPASPSPSPSAPESPSPSPSAPVSPEPSPSAPVSPDPSTPAPEPSAPAPESKPSATVAPKPSTPVVEASKPAESKSATPAPADRKLPSGTKTGGDEPPAWLDTAAAGKLALASAIALFFGVLILTAPRRRDES